MAKMFFFQCIAKEIQPFLTKYQTDKPVMPFIAEDIHKMLKQLLTRFIKATILKEMTLLQTLKLDLSDESLHAELQKVDVGFVASRELAELKNKNKIGDKDILAFKMDCSCILKQICSKLLFKSPVNYSLVRNLSCLNPQIQKTGKEACLKKMERVLKILVENNQLKLGICDNVMSEWKEYLYSQSDLAAFEERIDRLDSFYYGILANNPCFSNLWIVIEKLLLLSHGQATVERGFSVNKEISVENMLQHTLSAQRLIADHIKACNGIKNVAITKEMLIAAAGARQKYYLYLDTKKSEVKRKSTELKNTEIVEEIEDMKRKKKRIEQDVAALVKSADKLADQAENTGHWTLIAKSNSMRRTAKEKQNLLIKVEKEIEQKLSNLKN